MHIHSPLDHVLKLRVLQSPTAAALMLLMSAFFWVSRGGFLGKSHFLDSTYLIYRLAQNTDVPLPFMPWPPGSTAKLAAPGNNWMEREFTAGTIFGTSQDILPWIMERS